MRVAWQNQNLRRMEKIEPPPLKMLIRAFPLGNDLKAFLFPQSAFFAFPRLCHLKPTTATTTWNSKQMLDFAIFCLFRRSFLRKTGVSYYDKNIKIPLYIIRCHNRQTERACFATMLCSVSIFFVSCFSAVSCSCGGAVQRQKSFLLYAIIL